MNIKTHATKVGIPHLPGVKNVIAVASGKGGVGKSTVAVNLALALQHLGAKAGILDADIYGPSQPTALGTHQNPDSKDNKSIEPIVRHGVQSMSMGYLVDPDTAMIWRGPMASKALQKITHDTNWHDLDVLIVDLPPGTGDIQLTLCQKLPVTGAVVVTTPQDLALIDVDRAIGMFNKVSLPVLGIIENMSVFTCPHCHTDTHIFGQGGGAKMQAKFEVPLLGQIPLIPSIQEDMDAGMPTVAKDADSTEAKIYIEIARGMLTELAKRPKGFKAVMPKVVVEN